MRSVNRAWLLRCTALGLAAIATSSCGGGGSSGGTGSTPPPTTSTPTTPTLPPSPVTYTSAFGFTANASYPSPAVELRYVRVQQPDGPMTDTYEGGTATMFGSPGAATVSWDPAGGGATSVILNAERSAYPASSLSQSVEGARTFYIPSADGRSKRSLLWTHAPGSTVLAYVNEDASACPPYPTLGRCDESIRHFLAGPPTLQSDLPTTGSVRFEGNFQLTSVPTIGRGTSISLAVVVDYDRGTVSASEVASLSGASGIITRETYQISGSLRRDTSPRLTGTFEIAETGVKGNFVGDLYGSQGHDIGLLFTTSGGGAPGIGVLLGYQK